MLTQIKLIRCVLMVVGPLTLLCWNSSVLAQEIEW